MPTRTMSAIGADVGLVHGGGFSSRRSSMTGGGTVGWTEESETADANMSESDPISVFNGRGEEEEFAWTIDEAVEEMVGNHFGGDLATLGTMRPQTKTRLRDRLLAQGLMRKTEQHMRRGAVVGGNAGHQSPPWRAYNAVDGPEAFDRYNMNPPRNLVFPTKPASAAALDGSCGYQPRNPDANLCYPMQWRMFHGLDSNWVIQGRDGVSTDNSAAANNEKQWAFERSIALAKNYTAFNGQGHDGELEGYPLQASADLVGGGMRPLTLAPRDTELLSTLDPAMSVQYAFEHPRMSLEAQRQSPRGRKVAKSKLKDDVDSRLPMEPNTPNPPPQEHLQAVVVQQQPVADAQLHGEAGTMSDALASPDKGCHGHMDSKEKPPFPTVPPLPADYSPFAQSSPQRADERAAFPMSPVPPSHELFQDNPAPSWQGRDLFEGLSAAAEPVRLLSMEGREKGRSPISPAVLGGPRLTPSEPPTPASGFGTPHAPVPTGPLVERADATPDTTQDMVVTTPDWEHEAARFQAAARAGRAAPEGGDTPEPAGPGPTQRRESATDGRSEHMTCRGTPPERSSAIRRAAEARVRMPTVPQTRRVADRAIRTARRKPSFTDRGRRPTQ